VGITGARRLMDAFEIASSTRGTRVRMAKTLPRNAPRLGPEAVRDMVDRLRRDVAPDPFAALRDQNRDLMQSFADLKSRQDELGRLNRELEETNRGIVALYSELDQKAEQLREASDLKSRFLSYVSHEFRTPLNSIMGLSRILLDRLDGDLTPEQEKQVTYIRQSAESLTELVNDLLDLAKVEAGRIEVHRRTVSVDDLFAGLRGALRPLTANRTVELSMSTIGVLPAIVTDEGKVAQILRNLVSNALKFTERGSVTVTAEYRADADRMLFTVADTGIGIAPEHIAKIFEEFGQVDGPLQRKQKGTGLGLPLSRKLAELLGGTIEVESEPGQGSTFRLDLPANTGRAARPEGTAPRRLLVIDDEQPFRYLVRQMLKDAREFEVAEASDGDEGLDKIATLDPDVVLLDLQMPACDGFTVHQRLRSAGRLPALPVVVATSNPITPSLQAMLPGVAGFLPKHEIARDVLIGLLARVAAEKEGRP
jgi:signal transduction histidine kinase/ActR/RegA family two-component response regulator